MMSIKKSCYKDSYLHPCQSSDDANALYTNLLKSTHPNVSFPLGVVELSGGFNIVMKQTGISLAEILREHKDSMVKVLTDLEVEMVELEQANDEMGNELTSVRVGNKRKRKEGNQHVASISSTYRSFLMELFSLTLHLEKTNLVAKLDLNGIRVENHGSKPRLSILNVESKVEGGIDGWGQLKSFIEEMNKNCGIPNELMIDFLTELDTQHPSSMKDALKFAIFYDEEDNINFIHSLHEHVSVEKEWKDGGFQDPFGQNWQAMMLSYKNLKLLNEQNDQVIQAYGKDFFTNQSDQKYCLDLIRHMISHLKILKTKMSHSLKPQKLHICNRRRLMSLIMYAFPKAIPMLRRVVIVKQINL